MLALPKEFAYIVGPFLDAGIDEDRFQDFVVAYYSVCKANQNRNRCTETRNRIQEMIKEQNRLNSKLYNPYRNISLNQCFGENKVPASEWLNLTDWSEWS